jgi:hypothetical protein
MDVSTWLRNLGLENYIEAFQAHDVDAEVLPRLTADDLIALGVGRASPQAARRHCRARPGKGSGRGADDRRGATAWG